jgi:hypothetical protein
MRNRDSAHALTSADLRSQALFLSLVPIGEVEQRGWLYERIDELDTATWQQFFM